jgi:hypothetical protein
MAVVVFCGREVLSFCGLAERFLLSSSKVCVKVDGSGGARVETSVILVGSISMVTLPN